MSAEDTMTRSVVPLCLLLCAMLVEGAHAQQFKLTVASPIAGSMAEFKSAYFVVRADGCPAPAVAQITAKAEGVADGTRHSLTIRLGNMTQAGAYAVMGGWRPEGTWVVNLTARCKDMTAGAIVPIGPKGFTRESTTFFSRAATPAEVDEALTTLAANRGQR
jgi:hypothetical protein